MQLANYAHRFSSSLINWKHRFHAKLYVLARPDHAGINRASGLTALSAIQWRAEGKFYEWDEPVERSTQADVLYLLLQVDKRVFQCETVLQHVWVSLNLPIAHPGADACWNDNADQTRNGNGPQQ